MMLNRRKVEIRMTAGRASRIVKRMGEVKFPRLYARTLDRLEMAVQRKRQEAREVRKPPVDKRRRRRAG